MTAGGRTVLSILIVWSLSFQVSADSPPPVHMFSLSSRALRAFPGGEHGVIHTARAEEPRTAPPEAGDFSLAEPGPVSPSIESSAQGYLAMNGTPVLYLPPRRPERSGAAGWVEREVLDPILVPEVLKLGKVRVASSLINAVKRKNPLCLLNPIVFAASW